MIKEKKKKKEKKTKEEKVKYEERIIVEEIKNEKTKSGAHLPQ